MWYVKIDLSVTGHLHVVVWLTVCVELYLHSPVKPFWHDTCIQDQLHLDICFDLFADTLYGCGFNWDLSRLHAAKVAFVRVVVNEMCNC